MNPCSFNYLASAAVIGLQALAPRERVLIDSAWRFHQGDPADEGNALAYEVRSGGAWTEGQPEKWTPRGPDVKVGGGGLKAWILPTGNAFIKDAKLRHVRPQGHPGQRVLCPKRF